MDHNSYLVWWLLGVPIVLAVVDRMRMGSTPGREGHSNRPAVASGR